MSMPTPRLMLILDLAADASPQDLLPLVKAGDVAAVILRPQPGATAERLSPLIAALQKEGIAALLAEDVELASASGADGVHFSSPKAFTAGKSAVKPDGIAGVGGLSSRHEAMEVGEAGADYLLFGDFTATSEAAEATSDEVAWWAELFEIPCVGVAGAFDEVASLAKAGADFIALAPALLARKDAAAVAEAEARLAALETA